MIWNKLYIDILILYVPGVFFIALSQWLFRKPIEWIWFAFLVVMIIDSGHIYTTAWRTYFRPAERKRSILYLLFPVGFFILFFSWVHFGWNYLTSLIIYVTTFHNVRQLLGISRWYQKLNKNRSHVSDYFLYALCGLPFLAVHFKAFIPYSPFFTPGQIFLSPNAHFFNVVSNVYIVVLLSWIIFEVYRLYKYKDFNRTISVFFAALFYGCALFGGRTIEQIMFPLLMHHAIAYIALIDLSLRKMEPQKYSGFRPALAVLATTAIFGGAVYWIERVWVPAPNLLGTTVMAIILTGLFCHYTMDAYIWKRTHPDAAKIYA